MLSVNAVPPVGANEKLFRFVLSRRHVRKDTNTLKADAFVPHPHEELSVNRELEATDNETWTIGRTIADGLSKTLYGRGDVIAATYHSQKLKTIEAPVLGNPNHVNVIGWIKDDKPSQKLLHKRSRQWLSSLNNPLCMDEHSWNSAYPTRSQAAFQS